MKKLTIFAIFLAAAICSFKGYAQKKDTTSVREGIKKGAKSVGQSTSKGAKAVGRTTVKGAKAVGNATAEGASAVGNKTAEAASKSSSKVVDKTYKDKVGPHGETVYIDNKSQYYYINKKGTRVYIKVIDLKSRSN